MGFPGVSQVGLKMHGSTYDRILGGILMVFFISLCILTGIVAIISSL